MGKIIWHKIKILFELVKFEHTLFALPFAFMGMLIGSAGRPGAPKILLIIAAMTGARTAAMAFNRIADAAIDARNPRTSGRALPTGLISFKIVWFLIFISITVFFTAAYMLNKVCFYLAPLALFLLFFYSYTKRFTSLSHFVLGLVLAIAPAAGYLAVNTVLTPAPLVLSASVLAWAAGFDIIYACQDIDFDRKEQLFSLPASAGADKALMYSRLLHFFTVCGFLFCGVFIKAHFIYYVFVFICAALLVYEHSLLKGGELKNINTAFFKVNGLVSMTMFIAVLLNYRM